MRRAVSWLWNNGVVSTFMTGFFVILPIVITLVIMGWVGSKIVEWLGPGSYVGQGLREVGVHVVRTEELGWGEAVAHLTGWAIALGGIWLIGLLVKSVARQRVEERFHNFVNRIPIFKSVYKPVSQVVGMLKKDENTDIKAMQVVYCTFGEVRGAGMLGLLTSRQQFLFAGEPSLCVYVPTSPVPMSGGILFVPAASVTEVSMTVDELMKIYFSLGVLSPSVVPPAYQRTLLDGAAGG